MNFQKVRLDFSHRDRVARVALAVPKANILDRPMMAELDAAFALCAGRELNAVVLGAEGPNFSFGSSIEEHRCEHIPDALAALHGLLRRVTETPAPVIAAVRGRCLGGGFELVLACDLVVAEETAQFGCPEIKLGVFAPAASALLPVRTTQAIASHLLLTGESISGLDAARQGLVARVVKAGLEDALDHWLHADFLPRSSSSLSYACRAARLAIQRALVEDLPHLERLYLDGLMSTADAAEGINAFLEKRPPRWGQKKSKVES
ncbi:MAG TPA: enoyl-CoA hydratase/isomerase family protein [Terriglobia bacterium]|nr:enoyl-CoA hydratase/isomerase family protein [Terriglobia bacterium]